MIDFDGFRKHMLDAPRRIEKGLTNGGGWRPVLTIDSRGSLYVVPVEALVDDRERWDEAVAGRLSQLLVERGSRFYALVAPIWMVPADPDSLVMGAKYHPDRQEALAIHLAQRGESETWIAPVSRPNEAGPILGEWRRQDATLGLGVGPLDAAVGAVR